MSEAPAGILKGREKVGVLWCEVSGTFCMAPPREPEPTTSLLFCYPNTRNHGDEVFQEVDFETEKRGLKV